MQELYAPDFDLGLTLESGQAFRWRKAAGPQPHWYQGFIQNTPLRLQQKGERLLIEGALDARAVRHYFRLDDDLRQILRSIQKSSAHDPHILKIIRRHWGLRVTRQDPWECLISYLCSAVNNIPRIERIIEKLSRKFGARLGASLYKFPTPERLARASESELKTCELGFRAEFVRLAAKAINARELDLAKLRRLKYEEAKEALMSLQGVGDKVADCVLLFSLEKLEAFPVDRWIRRAMKALYFKNKEVSDDEIRVFARAHFGEFCGYANQYLFCEWRRQGKLGNSSSRLAAHSLQ